MPHNAYRIDCLTDRGASLLPVLRSLKLPPCLHSEKLKWPDFYTKKEWFAIVADMDVYTPEVGEVTFQGVTKVIVPTRQCAGTVPMSSFAEPIPEVFERFRV